MANIISRFMDGVRMLGLEVTLRSAIYPYQKAFHTGRFTHVHGAVSARGSYLAGASTLLRPQAVRAGQPEYAFPGRVLAHSRREQHVELTCENAMVQITVLAPDLMRVRVSPSGRFLPPFSYAVAKPDDDWAPAVFAVEETEQYLWIRTARLHCRVERAQMRLAFLDPDGSVVNADAAGAGWEVGSERVVCWKQMPLQEHLYGLGEKTTPLDKRGLTFAMWNTDPQTYDPGRDPIYANIPFYQGLVDGRAYGLFFDNSARGWFDFGLQTPGIARFEAECGEMRYYFFYGPQLSTVLERYTELTGRMIMPPLWALGYHQNRWSYYPAARVRQIAAEFRRRRIPCEAIHLDIDYMDGFRCFTWDSERFPDPVGLIADLHAQGFKVVAMIDPGIKVDRDYWVYRDGMDKDVFCKYPDGKPYRGPVWPGICHFPDFTSPRARDWWGDLYQGLVDTGIDGFWNDMNEPVVFGHVGDTFPDIVQHDWEGQGADHLRAHNVYGMQMARATSEGLRRLRPDQRPLVITRSLWAGAQRHNMHWLGDNRSNWESLRNAMQLTMNMGLSGVAFTGPDTGGFGGTADGELLIRWNQLSTFTPFFRNHTAKHTGDQEPWALGEACERLSREWIALRYHLLPYHYTAFWQSAQTGAPIVRPLVWAFQDDRHVPAIDDQFMFGDAFMVAPVYTPKTTSRRVYIPRGWWYDFWTHTLTGGPQITRLDAPIDRLPLLVRAGSIVPAWPAMQYVGEQPVEQLILHVYPGDGQSQLYEDDGMTWAFERGDCRLTRFACALRREQETNCLEVSRATEGPFVPPYTGIEVRLHGLERAPTQVQVDGTAVAGGTFAPADRTLTLQTGLFHTLHVTWPR